MKLFKELLISVAIVAVFFLLMGLVLPSHRHLTESVETNRNPTITFDFLNGFRRFKDWNAVSMRDPGAKLTLSGPETGVGSMVSYDSSVREVGKGSWKITGLQQDSRIDYAIVNSSMGGNKKSTITLTPSENGRSVEIKQVYDVDYGMNLIGRYAGMYVSSYEGEDMKMGLRKLSSLLSDIPNLPYNKMMVPLSPPKVVAMPAEGVLTISSGTVAQDESAIYVSVKQNDEWIKRVMDANGLEPVGPFRVVTSDSNSANYAYDLQQVVRKKGATTGAGLTGVTTQGPVKFQTIPARKAVMTSVSATDYNSLELTRGALRAWTLVHGYDISDRPFDVYKSGVDKSFTAGGADFDVYWPVK